MNPETLHFFVSVWMKFYFLLTPFFALSMFLLLTANAGPGRRTALALQVTVAVSVVSVALYFAGNDLFRILGITVDSFRVGAGALLFLSGVSLVHGKAASNADGEDVAVVPLAVPIIVGPGTMGALLVMGSEISSMQTRLVGLAALESAVLCVGAMLLAATAIERLLKRRGIAILSKLTGLMIAAIAAQMIFEGARNLL